MEPITAVGASLAVSGFVGGYVDSSYSKYKYFFGSHSNDLIKKTDICSSAIYELTDMSTYYIASTYAVKSSVSFASLGSKMLGVVPIALFKPACYWIGATLHTDRYYHYLNEYFEVKEAGNNLKKGLLPYYIPSQVDYQSISAYRTDNTDDYKNFKDMLFQNRASLFDLKSYKISLRTQDINESTDYKDIYKEVEIEESSVSKTISIDVKGLSYWSPKHLFKHAFTSCIKHDSTTRDDTKLDQYIKAKVDQGYTIKTNDASQLQSMCKYLNQNNVINARGESHKTIYLKNRTKLHICHESNVVRVFVRNQSLVERLKNLFSSSKAPSFEEAIINISKDGGINSIKISGALKKVKNDIIALSREELVKQVDIYDFNSAFSVTDFDHETSDVGKKFTLHTLKKQYKTSTIFNNIVGYLRDIGEYCYVKITASFKKSSSNFYFFMKLPILLLDVLVGVLFMMIMLPFSLQHYSKKMEFNDIYNSMDNKDLVKPVDQVKSLKRSVKVRGNEININLKGRTTFSCKKTESKNFIKNDLK